MFVLAHILGGFTLCLADFIALKPGNIQDTMTIFPMLGGFHKLSSQYPVLTHGNLKSHRDVLPHWGPGMASLKWVILSCRHVPSSSSRRSALILHPQCILNATPYYLRSPIVSILPSKVKCFEMQNLPWVYLDWFQQVHCNLMSSWKLKKKMRQERLEVWVPFPTMVITVLTLQKVGYKSKTGVTSKSHEWFSYTLWENGSPSL